MSEPEVVKIFESLSVPRPSSTSSCSFTAFPLLKSNGHKLGKDEGGCPCLLIATGNASKAQVRVPLVLENLAVLFDLRCQVSTPKAPSQTGTFTVLKCVAADPVVRSYFLSLLMGISAAIGRSSDKSKVAAVVEDLVELFRSLGKPPKEEIQGLWGELLLIQAAKDSVTLASAWRAQTGDCYDFNKGTERIEVKTTSQKERQHQFSLEQLCPPKETQIIVASIIVQRSGAGLSVFDLLDSIRRKISDEPQLHLRVTQRLHETLGNSWQSARDIRFDFEAALNSLSFFPSQEIPRIPLPLPAGVSRVTFLANLAGIAPLPPSFFADSGDLFRALRHPNRRC
jgi:Putative  PD-(D/E)XK family member, (DUF4420)